MTLKDTLADDAINVFVNTDEFAETVTYKPLCGGSRSIAAVVERETIQGVNEDGEDTVAPLFNVHVANDSTYGIASTELNVGGDLISFPVRNGKTATDRAIVRLVTIDDGMLVLECR